jgi:predicted nucleic acid-binding Zn ribbon protein
MDEAPPDVCEVCGEGPVERVLYPVAVHFKGSGFYSTDYGRGSGGRKREDSKDGAGSSDSEPKKTDEKKDKKEKAAET